MSDLVDRNAVIETLCDVICGEGVRCDISCSTIDLVKEILSEEPKTGKWIPVEERLPKYGDQVLIYMCDEPEIGRYRNGKWFVNYRGWVDGDDVIAWMPLPEPYQEENE